MIAVQFYGLRPKASLMGLTGRTPYETLLKQEATNGSVYLFEARFLRSLPLRLRSGLKATSVGMTRGLCPWRGLTKNASIQYPASRIDSFSDPSVSSVAKQYL